MRKYTSEKRERRGGDEKESIICQEEMVYKICNIYVFQI